MAKDFYATLGVPKTANDDEIKKAFRRLAHEHHPDKGGDQQKFKDVNEAYQVLGDKTKREKYDQFGSAAFDQQSGFGGGGASQGFGGFNVDFGDLGDMGDIFGDIFGFGGGRRGPTQRVGKNIETEVTLDFLESVNGAKKRIKLHTNQRCDTCSGSGGEPGTKQETCKTCKGKGQTQQAARTFFGNVQMNVQCPECSGLGTLHSALCTHCKGTAVERITHALEVQIPAGIADGEAIRVTEGGEYPGNGGKSGDLFIRVYVKSHPLFTRDGPDVVSTVRIPYSTLALGGDIEIDTVDGKGTLKIPESTEPGTVFQIRQKGFPNVRSGARGDQLVTIQPLVQKKLSREQREALGRLKEEGL